jgi:DNA helicase-2/ATP-dependent DNA helicase PcrA
MADYLADLNPAQREAVTCLDGPVLILAGPGSGKTRVKTRRIVHLLESGVRPHEILAITFTNKAAGEMRRRVDDLVPGNHRSLLLSLAGYHDGEIIPPDY